MFSSIRYKLLFFMILNIFIFAIFLYASNTIFSEKYYLNNKKNILVESSEKVKNILGNRDINEFINDYDSLYEINRIEKNIGGVINIGDENRYIYYPTVDYPRDKANPSMPPENEQNPFFLIDDILNHSMKKAEKKGILPLDKIKVWEPFDEKSFFIILEDPHLKIESLRFQSDLENGLKLLIWMPMAEISENVSIFNTFIQIIALITIIITGILSFIISKTFTKPIIKINNVAKKISNLDFSEKLNVKGKDEIGQLSLSINHLSDELNSTITELNIKNKKLLEDINKEKELDIIRKEFVSNVSHELKTPIFLIQGYAEGLQKIVKDEKKREFYCDIIMKETEKMDTLVKDLLDLTQIESGKISIHKIDFDIVELINNTLSKFQNIIKEKCIDLQKSIPQKCIVHADSERTEQIIINYLNNAINHVDENKIIKLSLEKEYELVKITIYNTGSHIENGSLTKIWDSFYKIDKARTREYGGSGLGLSIVKSIQDASNNSCGVNNVDGGIEFWFNL